VVVDLGEPFLAHVLEGGGGGDGEAHQEDIGLRVGEGTQTIVILLTGRIKQTQRIGLITDPTRIESVGDRRSTDGRCDASVYTQSIRRLRSKKRIDLHDGDGIVVEDGRDIFGGELVCCVRDQKTGLSHGTISDDDTPRKDG
jgi:hypothetical protein